MITGLRTSLSFAILHSQCEYTEQRLNLTLLSVSRGAYFFYYCELLLRSMFFAFFCFTPLAGPYLPTEEVLSQTSLQVILLDVMEQKPSTGAGTGRKLQNSTKSDVKIAPAVLQNGALVAYGSDDNEDTFMEDSGSATDKSDDESSDASMNFYGNRPKPFMFNNEMYYNAFEVSCYLKLFRTSLIKTYPRLTIRVPTREEQELIRKTKFDNELYHPKMKLIKAQDADDIFAGRIERFLSMNDDQNVIKEEEVMLDELITKPKATASNPIQMQIVSGTHHLEAIPCAMPAAAGRGRRHREALIDILSRPNESTDGDELVPIRLDLEVDNKRLREVFTYNLNEKRITPEVLAEVFCDDLDLNSATGIHIIAQAIRQQLDAHMPPPVIEEGQDMRILIKVNAQVGNEALADQFEWDVTNTSLTPEQFAKKTASECGLGGEFENVIAYAIRGNIEYNMRTFAFSETPVPANFPPRRNPLELEMYCPQVEVLTEAELEKKMRDQDRNTRRMRRLVYSNPYGGL